MPPQPRVSRFDGDDDDSGGRQSGGDEWQPSLSAPSVTAPRIKKSCSQHIKLGRRLADGLKKNNTNRHQKKKNCWAPRPPKTGPPPIGAARTSVTHPGPGHFRVWGGYRQQPDTQRAEIVTPEKKRTPILFSLAGGAGDGWMLACLDGMLGWGMDWGNGTAGQTTDDNPTRPTNPRPNLPLSDPELARRC